MENQQYIQKKSKKKKKAYKRSIQRVFTRKYSDDNLARLKRLIENHTDRGDERFFAIKVDGEFCVNKIANPQYFDDYKEFIDGQTESIEVIMYFGKSNNCNRHIFYLKESSLGSADIVDVDKKIEDALQKKDQDYLIKSLQDQVEQQAEYIEKLEEQVEELSAKTDIRGLLKEGAALLGAFKGVQTANSSLSGAKTQPDDAQVEVEPVTASNKTSEEDEEEEYDEAEEEARDAFDEVYNQFGEAGTKQVIGLMHHISQSTEFRDGINELIKKENAKNKKQSDKKPAN